MARDTGRKNGTYTIDDGQGDVLYTQRSDLTPTLKSRQSDVALLDKVDVNLANLHDEPLNKCRSDANQKTHRDDEVRS